VLGWLTLELTNSPFLVGVAMGMRGLPMFFVGVPAGVLADRFPRHRLLIATGALQAVTTATLGVLTLTGLVTLTHVLLLTLAGGAMRGIEHSARQSYTHDVVGPTELMHGSEILGFAHQALFPSLARDVLGVGPEGLGAMNAARSVGGILGLIVVTMRSATMGGGVLFLAVLVAFGASLVVLGFAPALVGFTGV